MTIKYLFLLTTLSSCIALSQAMIDPTLGAGHIVGGFHSLNLTQLKGKTTEDDHMMSEDALETLKTINGVAEYAVQKFNAENDKGMKLRLTNINGVQTQIVGGVNYMLNLSVVTEEGRHLRVTSLIYDHFGEYSMSDFHFY